MSFAESIKIRDTVVDTVGNWVWPAADNGAWDGPVKDWESHREKIKEYCKNFRVSVMAGGNCGLYPRLHSLLFSHVYTFEPDALNFYCLSQNCPYPNIYKFQAALGDQHKMIDLDRPSTSNMGMHKVSQTPGYIPMFTLDDFQFHALDLLHLDVEGYEPNVLAGGITTINAHKPVIFAENGVHYVKDFLEALGYKYVTNSVSDSIFIHKDH